MRTHRQVIGALIMMIMLGGWIASSAVASSGGTVTGTVLFQGTPPAPQPINVGAEQQCVVAHGGHAPVFEDVVVNGNGTLRDVLVYVTGQVPGTYAPPTTPVVFAQKGCVFVPHVAALMVGQPLDVRNDDPVLHNVRAQSKQGQAFNIAQPMQGMKTTKTFKTQEIGIPLKCDVHFWMTSYVHVLAHPFFAVTGEDGSFTITGLPPGTYTLEAWHGKLGTQTGTITVEAAGTQTLSFTYTAK